jgi:hypothetical protein
MVDSHIEELRRQLQGKRNSVFSFIQTWNSYADTFFTANFGSPANCFGREHVDQMLATHSRIQHGIFSDSGSALQSGGDGGVSTSIVDYLKKVLAQRFGVSNIPDAYLFFPVELGGLDLQSPFISTLQIRDSVLEDPSSLIDAFVETEKDCYHHAKTAFEKGDVDSEDYALREDPDWEPAEQQDRETFLSFEEFTRWREEFSMLGLRHQLNGLAVLYGELLKKPEPQSLGLLDGTGLARALLTLNMPNVSLRGILWDYDAMEPYWKWVLNLYGPEIVERFGGLSMVDFGVLPLGMLRLLRDTRVQWQG